MVTRVRLPAVCELSRYRARVAGSSVEIALYASRKPVCSPSRNVPLMFVAVLIGNDPSVATGWFVVVSIATMDPPLTPSSTYW